jgi:hypothetical protein
MRLFVAAAVSSDFARQDLRLLIPKSGASPSVRPEFAPVTPKVLAQALRALNTIW